MRQFLPKVTNLNWFYDGRKSTAGTLRREIYGTRLYLLLLTSGLAGGLFYNALIENTVSVTVDRPTQSIYEQLVKSHGASTLKCPCSEISISYGSFVQIQTTLHQVCLSAFINNSWLESLTSRNGDWSNVTDNNDFRIHGTSLFLVLRALCTLSQLLIKAAIQYSLATSVFTFDVPTESLFFSQVQSNLIALKNYYMTSSILNLTREVSHAGQYLSIFPSNWMYTLQSSEANELILMRPVLYENCSCATSSACTKPMFLNNQPIPSFVHGCLPLESILRSTVACLYNSTCVSQINIGHLVIGPLNPLLLSRFPINTTVNDLVAESFVEEWTSTISYSNFFDKCHPSYCQYPLTRRNYALFILTSVLGLYGGMTTVLYFLVPVLINLAGKVIDRLMGSNIQA